jgi:hypothetical protein
VASLAVTDDLEKTLPTPSERAPVGAGLILCIWVALTIALQAVVWVSGFKPQYLADAVEFGAARAEYFRVGEASVDVVRKAIRLQRETLPFWTTLARLGDFAFEPVMLCLRTLSIATMFAAFAALTGRTIGFMAGLRASALLQGYWVVSLALRVALTILLRRPEVETSMALILPPGGYPAALVVGLRQLDPFFLLGWFCLALGGWRRGQINLFMAFAICFGLAISEATVRIACTLVMGAGMRLSVF